MESCILDNALVVVVDTFLGMVECWRCLKLVESFILQGDSFGMVLVIFQTAFMKIQFDQQISFFILS